MLNVTTTDQAFVEDLNCASIEGVTAEYRPTIAFDSTEHILQIVVTLVAPTVPIAVKSFAEWVVGYVKKDPSKQPIINNYPIIRFYCYIMIIDSLVYS